MAYSELVKNIDTLRTYIRGFYIYGFLGRDDFAQKSGRTYDNEKRRLVNYLSEFVSARNDESGKVSFVSIDSRSLGRNPFYEVFKAKSFTAMDISLHFMILDILHEPEERKSLGQILDEIAKVYLRGFSAKMLPEESTLRKKLNEYAKLGLVKIERTGKTSLYSREATVDLAGAGDFLSFFSETAPCGVLGCFLLDKFSRAEVASSQIFQFKHHYLTNAIESDFLCDFFAAIREHRFLTVTQQRSIHARKVVVKVVPLMIYESVQDGRLYAMVYNQRNKFFTAMRFDYIIGLSLGEVYEGFEQRRTDFEPLKKHIWGVALKMNKRHNDITTSHIRFKIFIGENEEFIYQRLIREKRVGEVTRLDENTAEFNADIFEPMEIIPWVRTFISRILEFQCSDSQITRMFYHDVRKMKALYGLESGKTQITGESHAVQ